MFLLFYLQTKIEASNIDVSRRQCESKTIFTEETDATVHFIGGNKTQAIRQQVNRKFSSKVDCTIKDGFLLA